MGERLRAIGPLCCLFALSDQVTCEARCVSLNDDLVRRSYWNLPFHNHYYMQTKFHVAWISSFNRVSFCTVRLSSMVTHGQNLSHQKHDPYIGHYSFFYEASSTSNVSELTLSFSFSAWRLSVLFSDIVKSHSPTCLCLLPPHYYVSFFKVITTHSLASLHIPQSHPVRIGSFPFLPPSDVFFRRFSYMFSLFSSLEFSISSYIPLWLSVSFTFMLFPRSLHNVDKYTFCWPAYIIRCRKALSSYSVHGLSS